MEKSRSRACEDERCTIFQFCTISTARKKRENVKCVAKLRRKYIIFIKPLTRVARVPIIRIVFLSGLNAKIISSWFTRFKARNRTFDKLFLACLKCFDWLDSFLNFSLSRFDRDVGKNIIERRRQESANRLSAKRQRTNFWRITCPDISGVSLRKCSEG